MPDGDDRFKFWTAVRVEASDLTCEAKDENVEESMGRSEGGGAREETEPDGETDCAGAESEEEPRGGRSAADGARVELEKEDDGIETLGSREGTSAPVTRQRRAHSIMTPAKNGIFTSLAPEEERNAEGGC